MWRSSAQREAKPLLQLAKMQMCELPMGNGSVGTVESLTGMINGTPLAVTASGERLRGLANDHAAVGG
jgi:hypothetical protein